MKVINLDKDSLGLLNCFCDPGNLEDQIVVLDAAEEQLQSQAYEEQDDVAGNRLFTVAYQIKQLRLTLQRLRIAVSGGAEGV